MKLGQIWNVLAAFNALANLKKPPKIAYRLMKYERKLQSEHRLCEIQRSKIVCEIAGVAFGSPEAQTTVLKVGTPEFDAFLAKFNEFLENESDLQPIPLSMDALIEALDAEKGNVLSEADLALIEPFFEEPKAATDLKVVS